MTINNVAIIQKIDALKLVNKHRDIFVCKLLQSKLA